MKLLTIAFGSILLTIVVLYLTGCLNVVNVSDCVNAAKIDYNMTNPACYSHSFYNYYDCQCFARNCKLLSCTNSWPINFNLIR